MQSLKYFLPTLLLAAASFEACAQGDEKFYTEVNAGVLSEDTAFGGTLDFSLVGARLGYNLTSYLAIEGDLSTGTNTYSRSFAVPTYPTSSSGSLSVGTQDGKISAAYGVFGKASWPLGERFAAHARFGIAQFETETSVFYVNTETGATVQRDEKYEDDRLAVGLGGSFNVTDKIYARADVTRYGLDVGDFASEYNSVTIGAGFRF